MSKETYLSWLYSESASTLCEQEEEKTNMEWKTSTLGVLVRLFFFYYTVYTCTTVSSAQMNAQCQTLTAVIVQVHTEGNLSLLQREKPPEERVRESLLYAQRWESLENQATMQISSVSR